MECPATKSKMEVNIFIRFEKKIILYNMCSFGAKTNREWEFKAVQFEIKVCFDSKKVKLAKN